jgi:hypothetical protein
MGNLRDLRNEAARITNDTNKSIHVMNKAAEKIVWNMAECKKSTIKTMEEITNLSKEECRRITSIIISHHNKEGVADDTVLDASIAKLENKYNAQIAKILSAHKRFIEDRKEEMRKLRGIINLASTPSVERAN